MSLKKSLKITNFAQKPPLFFSFQQQHKYCYFSGILAPLTPSKSPLLEALLGNETNEIETKQIKERQKMSESNDANESLNLERFHWRSLRNGARRLARLNFGATWPDHWKHRRNIENVENGFQMRAPHGLGSFILCLPWITAVRRREGEWWSSLQQIFCSERKERLPLLAGGRRVVLINQHDRARILKSNL